MPPAVSAGFGGNATNFESEEQLEEIGKYSLAILGWQHLIFAVRVLDHSQRWPHRSVSNTPSLNRQTNWTASVYKQMEQAAIIKKRFPDLPVYVYTGFGNADGCAQRPAL